MLWNTIPKSRILYNPLPLALSLRFITSKSNVLPKGKDDIAWKELKKILAHNDVVFYEASRATKWMFKVFYFGAVCNFLYWANWAQLGYVTYQVKVQDDPPKYDLAPKSQRIKIATIMVAIGTVASTLLVVYPARNVTKLTLLQGGKNLRLETGSFIPRFKTYEYRIDSIRTRQPLQSKQETNPTTNRSLILMPEGRGRGFNVSRQGEFRNRDIWDRIFYEP